MTCGASAFAQHVVLSNKSALVPNWSRPSYNNEGILPCLCLKNFSRLPSLIWIVSRRALNHFLQKEAALALGGGFGIDKSKQWKLVVFNNIIE